MSEARRPMHDNERRSHNRQLAIRLAKAGIAIFPSVGKTPVVQAWQRLDTSIPPEDRAQIVKAFIEKHDREPLYVGCTIDPKIVKELWRKEPDAVPSISCGPSGLVVLDCDLPREKNGQNGVVNIKTYFDDRGEPFPADTPVTITQSGGVHLYYKNTVDHGCENGAFGPMNIQIKGRGGQIVAPGAMREDKACYNPAPGTPSLIETFAFNTIKPVPDHVVDHFRTKVVSNNAPVADGEQSEYERRVREAIREGLTDYDEIAGPLGFNFDALAEKDAEFKRLMEGRRGESSEDKDLSGSGAMFALSRCMHREFGPAFTVEEFAAILINHPAELFGTHCDDRQADDGEFRTYNIARDFLRGRNDNKIADGNAFGAVADDDGAISASETANATDGHRQKVLSRLSELREAASKGFPDPASIAPFDHRCGKTFTRKYLTATVAPGGRGKSSLVLQEAIAMATGRTDIVGQAVKRSKVLYFSGEDSLDLIHKRVGAICLHFDIDRTSLAHSLTTLSGLDRGFKIAGKDKTGRHVLNRVDIDALIEWATLDGFDVLIFDPLISFHNVSENQNVEMDAVVKSFARIAYQANVAVHIVHHVRKGGPGSNGTVDSNDSRGADAIIAAARLVRTVNPMLAAEAATAGVTETERVGMIRVGRESDKNNLAPPALSARWMRFESVSIGNATEDSPDDEIGVLLPVTLQKAEPHSPEQFSTILERLGNETWLANAQGGARWAGHMIAAVLGCDADDPAVAARLKLMVKNWKRAGYVVEKSETLEHRNTRKVLRPGDRKPTIDEAPTTVFEAVDDD